MNDATDLRPLAHYAKTLRPELPAEIFAPHPARLAWVAVHIAVIAGAGAALILGTPSLLGCLGLSLVIGHSYGVLGFLGHEILHGSVVKRRWLQNALGGLCLVPYCIGPELWRTWHNQFHHGHTSSVVDPDSFGDVRMLRAHPILKEIVKFAPGSGFPRSYLFLAFWLSAQALWVLFAHSKQFDYWSARKRRTQIAVFAGLVGFWGAVLAVVGPQMFVFLYLLPMAVANVLQMAYISTNHMLCDDTGDTNDPLANSLSVRVPRWMDWLHLNFSYHIEHHIFPSMNPRHAPRVQSSLRERFGAKYRVLSLWTALWTLYNTPRVHLTRSELVNLETGDVYSTLGAEGELPQKTETVSLPVRPRKMPASRQPGNKRRAA